MSFDAGIGFELGYCLGRGCLLYVFSTDFIRSKINEQKFTITNVVDKMSNSFYYEYVNDTKLNYEENIEENINIFKKFVSDKIEENTFKYKEKIEKNKKFDVFIDICGQRYEWNKMVAYKLLNELEKNNITYWISDRYRKDYEFDKDISALNNSKIYLTCLDENEPNFDSCILQGYAYNKEKYIIGYESNNVTYYVDGGQEMGVNLMVEQSCDILLNSYKKVINKILEIKNEEKN